MNDVTEAGNPTTPVARTEGGHFVKGQSGNPRGRPKHRHLVELQQDLEIAVREHLDVAQVRKIIEKIASMAVEGHIGAAKLLLDKIISNARSGDDGAGESGRTVVFRIENALIQHAPTEKPPISVEVVDVTPTEVKNG
jgi:Family of unknown function (DUF5681)